MSRPIHALILLTLHLAPLRLRAQVSEVARAYHDSVAALLPTFDSFPPAHPTRKHLSKVDLSSPSWARQYRTVLRRAASGSPTFDGHYIIVTWGCGTSCQMHAVLDAETGHVFPGRLTTAVGAEYRLDSALLIADPLSAMMAEAREDTSNAAVLLHCASCGSPAAYRWTGTRFEPVGRGAHPHLYPPDASGP